MIVSSMLMNCLYSDQAIGCWWLESSTAYPILPRDGLLSSRSPEKPVKLSTTNLPDQKLQLLQIHSAKGGGKVARALWLPVFTGCQCLIKWKSLQQPSLSVSGGLFLLLLLLRQIVFMQPAPGRHACSKEWGGLPMGLLKLMYSISYTSTLVTWNYVLIKLQATWPYLWSFSNLLHPRTQSQTNRGSVGGRRRWACSARLDWWVSPTWPHMFVPFFPWGMDPLSIHEVMDGVD